MKMKLRLLMILLSSILAIAVASTCIAADNSTAKYDNGFFDLLISCDWNPTQEERDGKLKAAFEQFGKDVFALTEGKNKIRKLYVYTNKDKMNDADIQLINKSGISNAWPGGFLNKSGNIETFTSKSNTERTPKFLGQTISHEFGHYAYALFDEYRGSKSTSTWPAKPLSGDNPRPTIMNDQKDYQVFSLAKDYDKPAEQKTAQWRVYKSSAWETLVRDPKDDKRPAKLKVYPSRTQYAELDKVPEKLSQPTTGWDSDFKIIWVEGTVVILVIDDSGSMSWGTPTPMDSAKSAAKQFIELMNFGESVAVVGFDSSARTEIDITKLVNQSDKDAVKAAIDSLVAGGGTNFTNALNQATSLLESGTDSTNSRSVVMLSDGQASMPSTSYYSTNNIPIFPIGLGDSINESILQQIATNTSGTYSASPTGDELAGVYAKIRQGLSGNEATVGVNEAELVPYAVQTWTTPIDSGYDASLKFALRWPAGQDANFTLQTPSGVIITSSSLPSNVTYASSSTFALYTVTNPETGNWISEAESSSEQPLAVTHEILSSSTLNAAMEISGGKFPEPIKIAVDVSAPDTVIGATVKADVYSPDGTLLKTLSLRDDGLTPDLMGNDGRYCGVFAGYSSDGDHSIHVTVTNPDGKARLDNSGALESGSEDSAVKLPSFMRSAKNIVKVSEVRELPDDSSAAITLYTDNRNNWGAITENGKEVWYKFYAVKDTTYFMQTSQLLSWDKYPMATEIHLYGADATTLLDSNKHYNGTNVSFLEWTAPLNAYYYLKLQHASPGTGNYIVTVGEKNVFTKSFDMKHGNSILLMLPAVMNKKRQ